MSASLVGSEMCIRDRRRPEETAQDHSELFVVARSTTVKDRLSLEEPERCLLYTSDAADDM
eukprot:902010-Alexandrium_andersonii.AAC.1